MHTHNSCTAWLTHNHIVSKTKQTQFYCYLWWNPCEEAESLRSFIAIYDGRPCKEAWSLYFQGTRSIWWEIVAADAHDADICCCWSAALVEEALEWQLRGQADPAEPKYSTGKLSQLQISIMKSSGSWKKSWSTEIPPSSTVRFTNLMFISTSLLSTTCMLSHWKDMWLSMGLISCFLGIAPGLGLCSKCIPIP